MFENISYIWVGIGLLVFIFIVCVCMIFLPKSINYYSEETYPIIKYIHENNLDIIKEDLEKAKKFDSWVDWPDKENVRGDYKIFPIYMFSVLSESRKKECNETYTLINNTPNVKTCAFLKLNPKSSMDKCTIWKDLSNTTLCCIFILDSPYCNTEECGIWVNGESKKLSKNSIIIYDSSKEHSIYNKSDDAIYMLMLDINRPKNVPDGISKKEYNSEIHDFIFNLRKTN